MAASDAKMTYRLDIGDAPVTIAPPAANSITSATNYIVSNAVSIDDSTTDQAENVDIDVSAVKWFYAHCDQDITVETNNGTTAVHTLTLKANEPYYWNGDKNDAFAFADPNTDITVFYLTNASGTNATNFQYAFGYDSSP